MTKRKIIKINLAECDGCGLCIPNCPEGAIQIIDKKARLISDLFCDGLGACIGHCPKNAITIEEREAKPYDEKKVMENIVPQGKNVIIAHLLHLKEHGEFIYLKQAMEALKEKNINIPMEEIHVAAHSAHSSCPGAKMMDLRGEWQQEHKKGQGAKGKGQDAKDEGEGSRVKEQEIRHIPSELRQWPVQIMLIPPNAPYFQGADLLIAADCVPFAYADFHRDLLKSRILLIGCPKLDNIELYKEKFTQIFKHNDIKSITYAHMEVPCCFGLVEIINEAIAGSGKKIPFKDITISIKGEKK